MDHKTQHLLIDEAIALATGPTGPAGPAGVLYVLRF